MWQETKHGLYKQFIFADFGHAWDFMQRVSTVINELGHHPRWQNEWNVVDFWLVTHEPEYGITDRDHELARAIDDIANQRAGGVGQSAQTEASTKPQRVAELQLYADGGSRGNPGPSASGFVLLDMDGKVLYEEGVFLGVTTNNQAEYQALKLGLDAAFRRFQAREVHVYMDSMLVVNQMKHIFKVKNRDLWPIHDAISQMLPKFGSVTFNHVPRELNKLADVEVNKALDAHLGSTAQRVN